MVVLVCGGRDYKDKERVFDELNNVDEECGGIWAIIHGGASGADSLGGLWARYRLRAEIVFPANWQFLKKSAGPVRNSYMLKFIIPNLALAFPGGYGTADMVSKARKAGVRVVVIDR